nr:immunoglobulin heavy chain junction region [Mus musculus]
CTSQLTGTWFAYW